VRIDGHWFDLGCDVKLRSGPSIIFGQLSGILLQRVKVVLEVRLYAKKHSVLFLTNQYERLALNLAWHHEMQFKFCDLLAQIRC
jgi:hypothetical protein